LEENVGWNFEENDADIQQAVASVDLICRHAKVLGNCIGQCIGDISTVTLKSKECKT
jgi:hypothetical protein